MSFTILEILKNATIINKIVEVFHVNLLYDVLIIMEVNSYERWS